MSVYVLWLLTFAVLGQKDSKTFIGFHNWYQFYIQQVEQNNILNVNFVPPGATWFEKDTQVVFPGFQWLFFFLSSSDSSRPGNFIKPSAFRKRTSGARNHVRQMTQAAIYFNRMSTEVYR